MISFLIRWASGINFLFFSIITTFIFITFYNLSNGFIISLDTNTFSKWSDHLIRLNFNLYAYYLENTFTTPPFFYTIPIIFISLCKILFGSQWEHAYLGLNLLWVFLSIVFFSKCLLILKVRPILISFTIPLMILSVDWMVWPR